MVTVVAVKSLKNRVNLDQIKNDKRLCHLALVKQSRLSVMPIDAKSWKIICNLGGIK
jgi:predicted RNA-binding protein with PUA-like domain